MALRTATALKIKIESFGLGISAHHRRPAPLANGDPTPLPYVTIHDRIASSSDPVSTAANVNRPRRVVDEECQIGVWQHEFGPPDGEGKRPRVEDPMLPEIIAALLDGAHLPPIGATSTTPGKVYKCKVLNGPFALEEPQEDNVIHDAILLLVTRRRVTVRPT